MERLNFAHLVRITLRLGLIILAALYFAGRSPGLSSLLARLAPYPELRIASSQTSPSARWDNEWRSGYTVVLENRGSGPATNVYFRIHSPGAVTRSEISSQVMYQVAPSGSGDPGELAIVIDRLPPQGSVSVGVWDVQWAETPQKLEISAVADSGAALRNVEPTGQEEATFAVSLLRMLAGRGWGAAEQRLAERQLAPAGDSLAGLLITRELVDAAILTCLLLVAAWVFAPGPLGAMLAGGIAGVFCFLFVNFTLPMEIVLLGLALIGMVEGLLYTMGRLSSALVLVLLVVVVLIVWFARDGLWEPPFALLAWPVATEIALWVWGRADVRPAAPA